MMLIIVELGRSGKHSNMSIRPLTSALQKKTETELHEVPSRIQQDLKHIKDWLAKQPHLRARTDDQWLLAFLRGCKFSLQRTKEKLDFFYTIKTLAPEFFSNRDPFSPELREIFNRNLIVMMLKPIEPSGPTVMLTRAKAADEEKTPFLSVVKASTMYVDILLNENDNFVISGAYAVYDLQDLSYKYVMQITPSILKKVIMCFYNAYPTRPKGIYFVNAPPIYEAVFNVLKGFADEKLGNRIKIFTEKNIDNFYKEVPLSILPSEYGGEGGSMDEICNKWKLKCESYRDWFVEDAMYYSEEAKRPEKERTSADVFGVEGAFRTLGVD